ncbi:MAG: nucleoside deaminase [Planctomycetales bacterium]|nr:nucleoside deaminase [Planctomycetales bacterium]
MDKFFQAAVEEARINMQRGAIPIGSVLVVDNVIIGRGRNRRHAGNAILHAEIDCLQDAGRLPAKAYRQATLYSTLSPCNMCSGASLLFGIPRIVVGENYTFRGPEDLLHAKSVSVRQEDDLECIDMMLEFIRTNVELWAEDIGVTADVVMHDLKLLCETRQSPTFHADLASGKLIRPTLLAF